MGRRFNFALFAVIFVFLVALVGCATMEKDTSKDTSMDTERLLSASGFQMRMADTPQKLDKVKSMTQKKLIQHKEKGKVAYIYADADDCKCLYVGTEKAYMKFRDLAADRLEADDLNARNENVMMDWDVWGGDPGSAWEYWQ